MGERSRHSEGDNSLNKSTLLVIAILVFGVGSAAPQDVRYDFDRAKDFSKYTTYKWVPIKGVDQLDDLTTKQLTAAVDAERATKGLSKTDSDAAALYFGFQTALLTEKQFTSYNTGWHDASHF